MRIRLHPLCEPGPSPIPDGQIPTDSDGQIPTDSENVSQLLRNHCVFNWNVRFERHMYAYMCVHVYQITPKNSQVGDSEGTTPS